MGLFNRKKKSEASVAPTITIDPCVGDADARTLRTNLERRDWRAARDFLVGVTDPDDHAFYIAICADVVGLEDWIGEWQDAEPESTLPILVRGGRAMYRAGEERGAAYASQTSADQLEKFHKWMTFAENCLDEVVEREPDDTTARTCLVTTSRGRSINPPEAQRRFDELIARHPTHLMGHMSRLQYLCEKWFGSHEQMFAFARESAAKAPAGNALGVLIPDAHIEKWLRIDRTEFDYFKQPEVLAEVNEAADRSIRHLDYRRRPGWPTVHNTFALVFCLGDDDRAAAEQFDLIGDLVTKYPWSYGSGRPAAWFEKVRRLSYEAIGR